MQPKFLCLFFAVALVAIVRGDGDGDEVKVEIMTAASADCVRKSKKYDKLSMHYVGTITETGVEFDSSHSRNEPFQFQLGAGQVIKGWDEGLLDMCVGEKRKLTIPSSKGYGEQGAGDKIPPNAGLTFEVELQDIQDGETPPNIFKDIDADDDKHLSQDEVSQYLKKQQEEYGQAEEEGDDKQHNEMIDQIFQHEDKDKDGLISYEEFSGPKHDEL